jgi:protein phosphatase
MNAMPDPQVLYAVTGVVVVGLVAWVVAVWTRRPEGARTAQTAQASGAPAVALAPSGGALAAPPPSALRADVAMRESAHSDVDVHVDDEDDQPTGPVALILVTAVGRTDPGLRRKHNEDSYAILEDHHLFVIADGMGRHAAGEVASKLCVEVMGEAFAKNQFADLTAQDGLPRRARQLRASIQLANERILNEARMNDAYHGMGTTVVSAYFSPNNQRVYIGHVGDSRCYRLRDGKLKQLTNDHTLGAVGIQGKSSNVLSRAVGVEEDVDVDVTMESPLPGDIYLLCSDGLSRMATDEEIGAILAAETADLEEANKKLIDLANSRGGRDNITTILVRVDQPERASLRAQRI